VTTTAGMNASIDVVEAARNDVGLYLFSHGGGFKAEAEDFLESSDSYRFLYLV
jgi:hypothetical protein